MSSHSSNLSFKAYFDKRMLKILLLGSMSGFPWVLIGSALSLWLKEDGLSRSTIGWAGLIFGVYAINFLWAPLIDKLQIPFLSKKFMQLSLNTPNNLKLKDGVDRYIFRKAMTDILPEEVSKRATKSDLSPFSTIEMQGVNKFALIKKLKFRANDFFDYDYIANHVFDNVEDNTIEAYQLYEFAEWLEKNDLFLD